MSFWKKIGLVDKDDFEMLHSEIEKLREDNRQMVEQNQQLIEVLVNQRHNEVQSLISSGIERVERNVSEMTALIERCSVNEIGKIEECETQIKQLEEVVGKAGVQMTDRWSSQLVKAERTITDACAEMKSDLTDVNKEHIQNHESKMEQFVENLISQKNHTMQNDIIAVIKEQILSILQEISQLQSGMGESVSEVLLLIRASEENLLQICDLIKVQVEGSLKKEELEKRFSESESHLLKRTEELEKILSDIELIRESLSNLWTVMKAIWVDSLLDDVEKSIG